MPQLVVVGRSISKDIALYGIFQTEFHRHNFYDMLYILYTFHVFILHLLCNLCIHCIVAYIKNAYI